MRLESQLIPRYSNAVAPTTQATSTQMRHSEQQGLRWRKKARTRQAIHDAALELFAEKGFEATTVDEIAERAEVSKATFFRYFGTKGEVIFSDEGDQLTLRQAILARPRSESDLVAAARAVREEWIPTLDPGRIERQTRAAASSPLLRGLSFDLGVRWQTVISEALAERRGIAAPDQRCRLVASLVFAAMSSAVNTWVQDGARSVVGAELDRAFRGLDRSVPRRRRAEPGSARACT